MKLLKQRFFRKNGITNCSKTQIFQGGCYPIHTTWQPHGSQFTIIEKVPDDCLVIRIKKPPKLDKEELLSTLGFDKSWVTVVKKNG